MQLQLLELHNCIIRKIIAKREQVMEFTTDFKMYILVDVMQ